MTIDTKALREKLAHYRYSATVPPADAARELYWALAANADALLDAADRLAALEQDNARLREALKDVTHPVAYLHRVAEADGCRLTSVPSDAGLFHIVQDVAKKALAAGGDQ